MDMKVTTCNIMRGEEGGDMSNIHLGPLHEDCGPLPSDVGGLSGKRCKTLRLSNCQIVKL